MVDRPVAILPWLDLDTEITIANVTFAKGSHLSSVLTQPELGQADALMDCFVNVQGLLGAHGAARTFGFVASGPPQDTAEHAAHTRRLRYAADALAAFAVAEERALKATAGTVETYIFNRMPAGPFAFRSVGGLHITDVRTFRIARPPWVPEYTLGFPFASKPLLQTLGCVIEQAMAGDARAQQIMTALDWFVKAHAHVLDVRGASNVIALGTAFELLTAVAQERVDKGKKLKFRVTALTGSSTLGQLAQALYQARSRDTHAGQVVDPLLPDQHMFYYQFGWKLFWLCLRAILENDLCSPQALQAAQQKSPGGRRRRRRRLQRLSIRMTKLIQLPVIERVRRQFGRSKQTLPQAIGGFGLPFAEKARDVAGVEQCCKSNARRLDELTKLSPKTVVAKRRKQAEFIELLRGLHANEFDWTGHPDACRRALRQTLLILRSGLYAAAREQESAPAAMTRQLAEELRATADNLTDIELQRLCGVYRQSYPDGAFLPIMGDLCLVQLMIGGDLVAGLAYMLIEHSTWKW